MRYPAFVIALFALIQASPAWPAEPITGNWVTEEKDAIITIAACGKTLCGRVSRFLEPPPEGIDQRDTNNPDPAKRSRRILGLPVLTSFRRDDDLWRGRIYDPKTGKSYRSVVRRISATRLEVKGCLGPFCQTQVWSRAR